MARLRGVEMGPRWWRASHPVDGVSGSFVPGAMAIGWPFYSRFICVRGR